MSFRSWGPDQARGDGSTSGRGTTGDDASTRWGTAVVPVRWVAAVVALECWVITFVTCTVDGVTLLATICTAVWLDTFGVFTRAFWFPGVEDSERLAAIDEELTFIETHPPTEQQDSGRA
jgi:hypothetical protein